MGHQPTRQDDAERRQLTVLFTDLVGSSSTKLDPEDMRFVIGAYHKCVAEMVTRFGLAPLPTASTRDQAGAARS
jgi:class 3 adenylate cyclase